VLNVEIPAHKLQVWQLQNMVEKSQNGIVLNVRVDIRIEKGIPPQP
jgi:hypothetical protein